ncbi:hypothetical protein N8500_10645 [Candidatus Puniceispirillum sp.]|nr:hypothetical protein [Candidatus Puniceispirillum sp.]
MGIKENWKDIGNILGNDKANHHIYIGYRTRNVRNALSSKIKFLYSTPIAKPIPMSNPIYRIVAMD